MFWKFSHLHCIYNLNQYLYFHLCFLFQHHTSHKADTEEQIRRIEERIPATGHWSHLSNELEKDLVAYIECKAKSNTSLTKPSRKIYWFHGFLFLHGAKKSVRRQETFLSVSL